MNIYRMRNNVLAETGQKVPVSWYGSARREQEILSTAQRKVAQGVSAEQQYADLNAARDKRKRRRERNVKTLLQGGYKQVLFVNV